MYFLLCHSNVKRDRGKWLNSRRALKGDAVQRNTVDPDVTEAGTDDQGSPGCWMVLGPGGGDMGVGLTSYLAVF